MSPSSIQENLSEIRRFIDEYCQKCGRNPKEVQLIAVSKTKPNEAIIDARASGQVHFGENRMQELQDKMTDLTDAEIQWHMIGTMQSNKIKYIANRVDWIHSVSKTKHLDEIEKRASESGRVINVLIQINISGEAQKSGCSIADLENLLIHAKTLPHILVKGLMGIASFVENPEDVRDEFRLLRETRDSHASFNDGNISLTELSMGMSGDLAIAIEEGATMVRVGSAIFGARNYA